MKKRILTVLAALMLTSTAYAGSLGMGLQMSIASIDASGSETEVGTGTKTLSDSENTKGSASHDGAIIAAIYAEYNTDFLERGDGNSLTIGASLVPMSADVSENDKSRTDSSTGADVASEADTGVRKANAELEDLRVYYVEIPVTGGFYIRGGMAQVDVITNESLGTGSTYANTDLDGTVLGVGYNHTLDNGVFVRAEGTYQSFDGTTLAGSGDTSVTVDEINGASAKFSIGKSF